LALVPVVAFALAPHAPTNLSAVAGASEPVVARLTWKASTSADTARYAVSVATDANGPFRVVGSSETTGYDFKDGLGGVAYYFRISAVNDAGEQSDSAAQPTGPVTAAWVSNPHAPASRTTNKCASCHISHSAQASPLMRTEISTSTPGQTATCLTCHDGKIASAGNIASGPRDSFGLASGHALDTSASAGGLTNTCASCHDPHGSAAKKPMLPESKINGKAVASAGTAWCLSCHDDSNSWYPSAYPPASAPQTDAAGYPTLGTWLGKSSYNESGNAHRLIPETTQTILPGQQVRRDQGDCLYCHAAHRGQNAYDGLLGTYRPTTSATLAADKAQGDYAAACFACHGGSTPSGFATAPVDIKRSVTGVGAGAGHRVKTAGGLLPVGAPLPCYECHNPHGSTRGNRSMISDVRGASLNTTDGPVGVRQFCFTCHTTADTGKGWDSATATYTVPTSGAEVVGLDRNGPVLMLKAGINAHAQAATGSCYDCHGSDYNTADGNNVHNPGPGGGTTSHAFTAGSDTVLAGDAGCTNSGSGCHGTDATRVSFAAYHPNAGCTSGTCHASPSKPTYAGNGDCQTCHDGGFVGAPARAVLVTDHFNETTHTATGLTNAVSSGGTASSRCVDCHNSAPANGLRGLVAQHTNITQVLGSPYGTTVSCVECHNDTRNNGNAEVLAGWSSDSCADCHSITSAAPQHSTTTAPSRPAYPTTTCSSSGTSCHPSPDLHAIHKDAAGCNLTGCHDYALQGIAPTGGSTCGTTGTCHTDKTDGSHGYSAAKHTGTPTPASYSINGSTYPSLACESCHSVELGTEHAVSTSSSAGKGCVTCHPTPRNTLTASWDKSTCAQGGCHTVGSTAPQHAKINTAHIPADGYSADCMTSGCHPGDLASVHSAVTTTTAGGQVRTSCMVCHADGVPTKSSCSGCHAPTWDELNALMDLHFAGSSHTASPASQTVTISGQSFGPVACTDCHAGQMALQATHNATYDNCSKCHPSPKNTLTPTWDKSCDQGGCHAPTSTMPMHASIDASHAPVAGQTCYAAGCHPSTGTDSLAQTHRNASAILGGQVRTSCQVCHWNGTPASRECASCHADRVDGTHGGNHTLNTVGSAYDNTTITGCTGSGAGCHGTAPATYQAIHPNSGCLAGPCHTAANHNDVAFNDPNTCQNCHGGGGVTYDNAPDVVALTDAAPGGHYSETTHTATPAATVSAGGTYSATCATCHTPVSVSGIDGLYNQHQGLDTLGSTTCADCHNKNAAIQAIVTDSTRTDSCAACHTASVLPTMAQHATTAPAVLGVEKPGITACARIGCHATLDLHALHKSNASGNANGCTMTGCHDPAKQGSKPTATSCGVGGDCHTGDPHSPAAHLTLASEECVACHVAGGDLKQVHPRGCTTCHNNPTYPTLPAGKRECVSCHVTGTVGSHDYSPADRANHYDETRHTALDGSAGDLSCSDCHSLSLAPEHEVVLPQGNLSSDGAVTCVECHNDPYAKQVINSQWEFNSGTWHECNDCHTDAGLGTKHDTRFAKHSAIENTSCDGGGCHGSAVLGLNDIETIHAAAVDSSGRTSCLVCHTRGADTALAGSSCGATGTCHTDKAPGNHGSATSHAFSAASNYNNTTIAGCTNSGVGCHNSETTYQSFAAYHPASGCLAGVCHTSTSKPTFNGKSHECVSCHDGSFAGAPANTPLHQPYGLGHYSETTHTATGLGTTVSAGGTASASCNDCHNATNLGNSDVRQLYNQHQGLPAPYVDTTCYDCHNKNVYVTGVIKSSWLTKRCDACHNTTVLGVGFEQHGTTAPVVAAIAGTYALTGQSCLTAGCHSTSNLHAIHKDAAGGCALEGCHNFSAQAVLPSGASCGATGTCHKAAEPHDATLLNSTHNGSGVPLAQPGSARTSVTVSTTVDSQTFASTTWPSGWTRTPTANVTLVNTAGRQNGTYATQMAATSTTRVTPTFYRDYTLTGYQTSQITFWTVTGALSTGATDYTRVEYSTNAGSTWTQIYNVTAASSASTQTISIPAGGTTRIRFSGYYNATTEYSAFDNISVVGINTTVSTVDLPANSTAAASCQNNPNGTECHTVTDVRTLHAATPGDCANCHKAGGPTNNCQTAACHSTQFVNVDVHNSVNHATTQISTAAGQPFAGTGIGATTCTGCHDDSISLEHNTLSAYSATPCSMCHKKAANSGAPTNVTSADTQATIAKAAGTALCTDCHTTVTAASPHIQRAGTTAALGSMQFDPTWSGHKSYDTMYGSRNGGTGSTFNGQATSITWTLPTATSWLKTGWTTTTQAVRCDDCHGSITGAVGPHGASMAINIATGYDNSYSDGSLTLGTRTGATTPAMSNTSNICAKCHTDASMGYNNVHSRNNHYVSCTSCHAKTPHAWKRPRLIGYTSDPPPYRSTGVTGITQRSYTPTGWSKGYCASSGCSADHPSATTPLWP
jgi:predicted CXXCH cytochrome family protein